MNIMLRSIFILWLIVSIFLTQLAFADAIILSDGKRVSVNKVWREKGKVVGSINGSTIAFDRRDVLKIEREGDSDREKDGGFVFSFWNSTMTIEDILITSRRHDIPLHKYGLISINIKFNPVTSSKYARTATHYFYHTQLLGKHATVELFLTPTSKKLHTLLVRWSTLTMKGRVEFEREISQIISEKYGAPKGGGKKIIGKNVLWQPSSRVNIEFEMMPGNFIVTYKDRLMMQLKKTEEQKTTNKKRAKYLQVDKEKF